MKAAAGAAGDGDKEERKDDRRVLGIQIPRRRHHRQLLTFTGKHGGHEQPEYNQHKCRDELQRVDVITGLQERPNR